MYTNPYAAPQAGVAPAASQLQLFFAPVPNNINQPACLPQLQFTRQEAQQYQRQIVADVIDIIQKEAHKSTPRSHAYNTILAAGFNHPKFAEMCQSVVTAIEATYWLNRHNNQPFDSVASGIATFVVGGIIGEMWLMDKGNPNASNAARSIASIQLTAHEDAELRQNLQILQQYRNLILEADAYIRQLNQRAAQGQPMYPSHSPTAAPPGLGGVAGNQPYPSNNPTAALTSAAAYQNQPLGAMNMQQDSSLANLSDAELIELGLQPSAIRAKFGQPQTQQPQPVFHQPAPMTAAPTVNPEPEQRITVVLDSAKPATHQAVGEIVKQALNTAPIGVPFQPNGLDVSNYVSRVQVQQRPLSFNNLWVDFHPFVFDCYMVTLQNGLTVQELVYKNPSLSTIGLEFLEPFIEKWKEMHPDKHYIPIINNGGRASGQMNQKELESTIDSNLVYLTKRFTDEETLACEIKARELIKDEELLRIFEKVRPQMYAVTPEYIVCDNMDEISHTALTEMRSDDKANAVVREFVHVHFVSTDGTEESKLSDSVLTEYLMGDDIDLDTTRGLLEDVGTSQTLRNDINNTLTDHVNECLQNEFQFEVRIDSFLTDWDDLLTYILKQEGAGVLNKFETRMKTRVTHLFTNPTKEQIQQYDSNVQSITDFDDTYNQCYATKGVMITVNATVGSALGFEVGKPLVINNERNPYLFDLITEINGDYARKSYRNMYVQFTDGTIFRASIQFFNKDNVHLWRIK